MNNIKYESGIFLVFLLIIFSFDFHFLWLSYDLLCILSVFYFLKKPNLILLFLLSVFLIYFLVSLLFNGLYFISFLSFWDTTKHIFLMYLLFDLFSNLPTNRLTDFINLMFKSLTYIFFLEFIIVCYQYYNNYYIDDISGTFGTAASHSLAYLTLLYIIILIEKKSNIIYLLFIVGLASFMNYAASNMGFFVLLFVIFIFKYIKQIKFILPFLIPIILTLLFNLTIIMETPFGNRIMAFFMFDNIYTEEGMVKNGRSWLLVYAILLGEFLGAGFGAFSEIYSQAGWKIDILLHEQINISEVIHLVAEYGIIGLLLIISLFCSIFIIFLSKVENIIFTILLFFLILFYNRALMDERIIFIFMFMILIILINEKLQKKENGL